MKIKTSELTGAALDRAVMLARGFTYQQGMPGSEWAADDRCKPATWRLNPSGNRWACMRCTDEDLPSTDWSQGGPIIERFVITVERGIDSFFANTNKYWWPTDAGGTEVRDEYTVEGSTYLQAAMRCFVASKLGDEVDVPEELLK